MKYDTYSFITYIYVHDMCNIQQLKKHLLKHNVFLSILRKKLKNTFLHLKIELL